MERRGSEHEKEAKRGVNNLPYGHGNAAVSWIGWNAEPTAFEYGLLVPVRVSVTLICTPTFVNPLAKNQ
jgi:hypothetical protein